MPCRAVHLLPDVRGRGRLLPDVRGRGAAVDLARHKGKGGLWWCCHITRGQRRSNKSTIRLEQRTAGSKASGKQQWRYSSKAATAMRMQGQANCPLNELRQIQANSIGDRDRTATASARRTSVAFAAERKQNASQRSDRLTFTR